MALWQTRHVAGLLGAIDPSIVVEEVIVSTVGDRRQSVAIHEIGGKGVFVKEVQAAVLDGRADIAVHSGKDLPAEGPSGLIITAVPERADARDALIGTSLGALKSGDVVATGSVRRRVQLAALCEGLRFEELRGNIDTRLSRAGEFDAIVLAAAGLDRLGRTSRDLERLDVDTVVPQVAQGALAVEARVDDGELRALLSEIEHAPTRRCVDAERAFLRTLGGDCSMPAGAHAVLVGNQVRCTGILAPGIESRPQREVHVGSDAAQVGIAVATSLLGRCT